MERISNFFSNKNVLFILAAGASITVSLAIMKTLNKKGKKGGRYSCDQGLGGYEKSSAGKRKKSMLYTKTGDSGTSSLYNGERRPKADITFEVLGHQDELNAAIGIAREYCAMSKNGLDEMLSEISSRLFDLGAAVATPVQTSSERKKAYTEFSPKHTAILEGWIDKVDGSLPPITNFVIPSGGLSSTHLNLARAICRRAERAVYPLIERDQVDAEVGRYLNRLSDFLFACVRASAMREGREEVIWKKATLLEEEPETPPPQDSNIISPKSSELLDVIVDILPPN